MTGLFLRGCVAMAVTAAWCLAVRAADDRAVEAAAEADGPSDVDRGGMVVVDDMDMLPPVPAGTVVPMFDQMVFRTDGQWNLPGRLPAVAVRGGTMSRLAGVRRRGTGRIDLLARVCSLSGRQRRALELALESDLRRAAGEIDAVRDKYVGRNVENFDRLTFENDVLACREVIASAIGSGSLLARMAEDVLDPEQAATRRRWEQQRRECRWRATVAAALEPLDEVVGLSSGQYATLEAYLLESVPPLEVDAVGGPRPPLPVAIAFHRLTDERLQEMLDPPQWHRLRGHVDRWERVAMDEPVEEQTGRKALAAEPGPVDEEWEP